MNTTGGSEQQQVLEENKIILLFKHMSFAYGDYDRQRNLVFRFVIFISGCIFLAYQSQLITAGLFVYIFLLHEYLYIQNVVNSYFNRGIAVQVMGLTAATDQITNHLKNHAGGDTDDTQPTSGEEEVSH